MLLSTLNAAADAGAWSNFAGACLQSALAACNLLSAVSDADLHRLAIGESLLCVASGVAKRLVHVIVSQQQDADKKPVVEEPAADAEADPYMAMLNQCGGKSKAQAAAEAAAQVRCCWNTEDGMLNMNAA